MTRVYTCDTPAPAAVAIRDRPVRSALVRPEPRRRGRPPAGARHAPKQHAHSRRRGPACGPRANAPAGSRANSHERRPRSLGLPGGGAGAQRRSGGTTAAAARAPGINRDHRFRRPNGDADRPPGARVERILRAAAAHRELGPGAGAESEGVHSLRRPSIGPRQGRAGGAGLHLRERPAGAGHLLRHAGDRRGPGRPRGGRERTGVRPRRDPSRARGPGIAAGAARGDAGLDEPR